MNTDPVTAHAVLKLSLHGTLLRNGQKPIPVESAIVHEGDVIRYTVVALNVGDRKTQKIIPSALIPHGTVFMHAEIGQAERIEYSLNHGRTWSVKPSVFMHKADGTVIQKYAAPSQYNELRWIITQPLNPGTSTACVYEVEVR